MNELEKMENIETIEVLSERPANAWTEEEIQAVVDVLQSIEDSYEVERKRRSSRGRGKRRKHIGRIKIGRRF